MKKDFSQPLKLSGQVSFCLLIQDNVTGKFFVTHPDDPNEEDFYNVLFFTLKNNISTSLAHELAKFLYTSYGYSLVRFRELVRVTHTGWSFVDETLGSYGDDVCLHTVVDITNNAREIVDGEVRSWVDLKELLTCLNRSPFGDIMAKRGIAQLINQVDILGYT